MSQILDGFFLGVRNFDVHALAAVIAVSAPNLRFVVDRDCFVSQQPG